MKKSLLIAALAVSLIFSSCGGGKTGDREPPAEQIAAAVIVGQTGLPTLYSVKHGDKDFDFIAESYFGDLADSVEDGAVCIAAGAEASEISVFRLKDADAAESSRASLETYIKDRASVFYGYAPEQSELAERGIVSVHGRYAAIFICADTDRAEKDFLASFGDGASTLSLADVSVFSPTTGEVSDSTTKAEPVTQTNTEPVTEHVSDSVTESPSAPETDAVTEAMTAAPTETEPVTEPVTDVPVVVPVEDVYDHDAVFRAYKTGDTSGLGNKNLAVLRACVSVIEQVIESGMTEYERELAIHDYIISYAHYDNNTLSQLPNFTPDPDNGNPYGVLINQKAICIGYASTFQLFMDLLDVECVTVHGFYRDGTDYHAWNTVCLDGEWYCVDVTWDDPISASPVSEETAHKYFNVTSDFMRVTGHHWDASTIPESTSTKYAWGYNSAGEDQAASDPVAAA